MKDRESGAPELGVSWVAQVVGWQLVGSVETRERLLLHNFIISQLKQPLWTITFFSTIR